MAKKPKKALTARFLVKATDRWFATGIDLAKGDVVLIAASGRWSHGYEGSRRTAYGPAGYRKKDASALSAEANVGALLARVGRSRPVLAGAKATFIVTADGRLSLAMNDSEFSDNTGSVVATIEVNQNRTVSVTRLQLEEYRKVKRTLVVGPLAYLSAAAHSYFDGHTRIYGQLAIRGDKSDAVTEVELEVVQNARVIARAPLSATARRALLKGFGEKGSVEFLHTAAGQPRLLFELASAEAARVNGSRDGTLLLRVRVRTRSGSEVSRDFGTVQILVRFTGRNRYGGRDTELGGDDWVTPSTRDVLDHYTQVTWGDMSNMNGGAFPPHASHQAGIDADGWYEGYNARGKACADAMIDLLNEPIFGRRVSLVGVTLTAAFAKAIRGVKLDDGRRAVDVIQNWPDHDTHFHWRMG